MIKKLLLGLSIALISCSERTNVAGTTDTEIGGDPKGIVVENGETVANANVFAIPIDYVPGFDSKSIIVHSKTNSSGQFQLSLDPERKYNLLVRNMLNTSATFRSYHQGLLNSDTLELSPNVTVEISISGDFQEYFLIGTDILGEFINDSTYSLIHVPAGELTALYGISEDGEPVKIMEDVVTSSFDTTYLPYRKRIAFVYNTEEVLGVQTNQILKGIKSIFYTVDSIHVDNLNENFFQNYDLIYLDRSVKSLKNTVGESYDEEFQSTGRSIAIGSSQVVDALGLLDNSLIGLTLNNSAFIGEKTIPILASGIPSNISWFEPVTSASIQLIVNETNPRVIGFSLEKGDAMSNGILSEGRRCVIPETEIDGVLSEEMMGYINRVVLWCSGVDISPLQY